MIERNVNKNKVCWRQVLSLCFFTFLSFYGFSYIGFNQPLLKGLYAITIPLIFIYSIEIFFIKQEKERYLKVMSLITFFTFFSIFMSYFFWGQSLVLGYKAICPHLAIILYFYLLKTTPSQKSIEAFIWIFAVTYIVLWCYAISQSPNIVFGDVDESPDLSRGIFRPEIKGRGFLVLAFFLSLNKYICYKKKVFVLIAIVIFTFIILQVTRQIIFWTFLIGLYYLLRNNKKLWISIGLIGLLSLAIINLIEIPDDSVVGELLRITENQIENQESGEENIRIKEYRYFFTEFSKNIVTDILGNGSPHYDSTYGKFYENVSQYSYRYFLSDVGYAQMFVIIGFVGLILYLFLFLRATRQKVSDKAKFAQLFIIYQLFANIAASWYSHDVICICICIYLLSIDKISIIPFKTKVGF